jgi:N-acetylglucosamine repressor
MRTGDNGYIKELNYKLILDTIRTNGAVSRADLSRLTGLTRSTCSVTCERMINQGIIIETGKVDSTGGRPPILLQINNRAGAVLGLKMMDDLIAGAAIDLGGNIIQQRSIPMVRKLDPESYLLRFEEFIQTILEEHRKNYPFIPILGIGIGIGGRVSSEGVLLDSSVMQWTKVPLRQRLQKKFNMPVHIENDVNTFAIGEKFFGAGRVYETFLCLSVGEGTGLGIIIDGKLYNGSHHGAGEIGHTRITFDPDAPRCSCGKQGCLEVFTSDHALQEAYQTATGENVGIEELIARAATGDTYALQVFSRAGKYLGTALSTLVNLFDPQAIIIGGERTNAAQYFLPELKKHLQENCVYDLAQEVALIVLQPSNDDWIRGVAALAIREFFSTNTLWRE